jgi:TetR/AcrR family transcriptional repressor of nem operon
LGIGRLLSYSVRGYLTERHRDRPEEGCALATLGPEIARARVPLRQALDEGIAALAEVLKQEIGARRPQLDEASRGRAALAVLAALAGGLIIARAVASDPERSRAALDAAAEMAMGVATET